MPLYPKTRKSINYSKVVQTPLFCLQNIPYLETYLSSFPLGYNLKLCIHVLAPTVKKKMIGSDILQAESIKSLF